MHQHFHRRLLNSGVVPWVGKQLPLPRPHACAGEPAPGSAGAPGRNGLWTRERFPRFRRKLGSSSMSFSKRIRRPAGAVLAAAAVMLAAAAVMLAAPPATALTPAVTVTPPPSPFSGNAQAANPLASDEGRYLVRFTKGSDVATEAQSLQVQGVRIGRTFSAAVRGAAITATKAQAAALAR